ncbi:uncharacterized protein TM35_000071720 [Trypanosoma theileri]|uniref:Uncharacterized protein n=1 Tax=Trypanosoma theileri TaxID=67003 RepID=A0A1X0P1N4_9TRYP|nr:uncharacterized protein TM35_000071720 [Trypanosoma theileri]ORC90748.1 hypothetical protein TM35_000071720 [Trypanosoma theileri]
MWRLSLLKRVTGSVGSKVKELSSSQQPYQRVLQLLHSDGEGLPAAKGVFDEFRAFYRQVTTNTTTVLRAEVKPLEEFCGNSSDVEPFALVMMKVLCDLQKLEELRFLFAQCVLEIPSPSIELFNVYLLAISLTDTFNQYEIENVVEMMRTKKVHPDVVTQLSLFIIYLRLGQDYSVWWPSIREEVLRIAKSGQRRQHPLLEVRLQHCFQTLLRVHHDVTMIQECFDLLKLIDKERISSRLLLPYMLLSANNAATPPAITVQLIELLENACKLEATSSENSSTTPSSEVDSKEEKKDNQYLNDPVLNNELTAMKLMAKCAKWGDASSASYLYRYLCDHPGVVSPANQTSLILLYIEAMAQAGMLKEALLLLEDEVPDANAQPGPRPKLFLESRRITLLNADPIMTLVRLLAVGGTNIEEGLTILEERQASGGRVSQKSLNVLLEACVLLKDETRASMVFNTFNSFGTQKTSRTFLLLLLASPDPVYSAERLKEVMSEMTDMGIDLSPDFLRGALELAIDAQNISVAMQMIEYHETKNVSIESKLSIRLMRLLCLVVDIESVRRLLRVLRATHSPVDPRGLSLCVATFKKWLIPCDDLEAH